jgi:hypothetical protein
MYLNLQARPEAEIQARADRLRVVARTAPEEYKPRLRKLMTDVWPNYDVYQSRPTGAIPVAVLTPVRDPAAASGGHDG